MTRQEHILSLVSLFKNKALKIILMKIVMMPHNAGTLYHKLCAVALENNLNVRSIVDLYNCANKTDIQYYEVEKILILS
jgi:hypothetical protein